MIELISLASYGKMVLVKKSRKAFDPKAFLAKVGDGKTISKYQKDQIVFSQGAIADAIFYLQKGKIKLTVVSERGKEAVVGVLDRVTFLARDVSTGIRYGSQQLRRSSNH
jgi:CRP/FNR family transcriptional regulator, cyclic AMP receptor protein